MSVLELIVVHEIYELLKTPPVDNVVSTYWMGLYDSEIIPSSSFTTIAMMISIFDETKRIKFEDWARVMRKDSKIESYNKF